MKGGTLAVNLLEKQKKKVMLNKNIDQIMTRMLNLNPNSFEIFTSSKSYFFNVFTE